MVCVCVWPKEKRSVECRCLSVSIYLSISPHQVFDMLADTSLDLPGRVARNTRRFRSQMTAAGFVISGDDHPISPVMLGDARLAAAMSDRLLGLGIYVIGFSFPVVPKGKARIRVQISASHTDEEIDRTVDAFIRVGKEMGVV